MSFAVTASISAQNTFTNAIDVQGYFSLSVADLAGGTIATVQRRLNSAGTWRDVEAYTSDIETYGFEPEPVQYRVGVKTGEYGSGTAVVRLGREGRNGGFETFPS
jgi:hypothetical protein